jgi:hypothetical protein
MVGAQNFHDSSTWLLLMTLFFQPEDHYLYENFESRSNCAQGHFLGNDIIGQDVNKGKFEFSRLCNFERETPSYSSLEEINVKQINKEQQIIY